MAKSVVRPGRGPQRVEEPLRRALVDLGSEAGLSGVTVSALARRSGIGRTTFYRYHGGVGAYVESVREQVLGELGEAFRAAQLEAGRDVGLYPILTARITAVLSVVEQRADLLRLLWRDADAVGFRHRVHLLLSGLLADDFEVLGARVDAAYCPPEYLLAFLSHAFVGAVTTWLAKSPREPIEDMTFYLAALMSGSTAEFLQEGRAAVGSRLSGPPRLGRGGLSGSR
ncbi:TetR/AcrR family transcriptional regulator C-terminal domain-containing protein [Saccharopolyspora sp. NFXS83]|uniref:TetR/AcrR family transcriptional regulator n=1 Tax=Saccharopolyspora sp. NFXS83 TaxID=2993560 RepID=UPI00224A9A08|nr:TetR/AcrR family transcriptional regulator [Saccharopolyspora sp. NFXS83]MCX2729836.1 TetR/AcrR family transcriptional regulator C-terminal domain-containing protein [Saccharopolyspora sp. NFXS83]